uniref:UDP-N-acetylenolpyruvoylglucosamine reductase n=1 Tax=Candidatus Aschnera chinzeii TaxID=1485666 RepID=A0AAT9G588_9ENTR|nr:MAG: UDP-N-acetylmuramate dehydrogenase [Candidatus Aschnera chinzeii]
MNLFKNYKTLKNLNTFKLDVKARSIQYVYSLQELILSWQYAQKYNLPVLLLGMGSNVLFINNFNGMVIINKIKKLKITESIHEWFIHVGAGNNWHQLIIKLMEKGIYGLENMAFIPGTVGAAPIQNISAYGMEFKDVCNYVDVINLINLKQYRLNKSNCKFGYRNSIFQNTYYKNYAIIAVGLKLLKTWQPRLTHTDLLCLKKHSITSQNILNIIYKIRYKKIPNPKYIGNAGSFFKNAILSKKKANLIKQQYPTCPIYPNSHNTVKISSAWLITQCNLKGYQIGGAAVDATQALILINKNHATGNDIIKLAYFVHKTVLDKFNIYLEPEVNIIDINGKINLRNNFYEPN